MAIGKSDPVSYTCTCNQPGSVLLFYRYFANTPALPAEHIDKLQDLEALAAFHRSLGEKHDLAGKIRVSKEGFNITIAGSQAGIEAYISACCSHWSFSGLKLECPSESPDEEVQRRRNAFFKPTPGCRCVFSGILNVRVTAEITPLGVTNYAPSTWQAVQALEPALFHQKCLEEDVKLIDVRNHYESKIGYFVSAKGGEALKPPIRRFSQWPQWVKEHGDEISGAVTDPGDGIAEPQVLTYCTGGIRCEKGVRWMHEYLSRDSRGRNTIYTLKGGIAAYLTWMEAEIAAGRKRLSDSLFKGQNYVFDARGSMGLPGALPVSHCHSCGIPSHRLDKCGSPGCHLVLVVCATCGLGDVRCCDSCGELHGARGVVAERPGKSAKPICECEKEREKELWGGERVQEPRTQGWRRRQRMDGAAKRLDIKIALGG